MTEVLTQLFEKNGQGRRIMTKFQLSSLTRKGRIIMTKVSTSAH